MVYISIIIVMNIFINDSYNMNENINNGYMNIIKILL